ncbi:MAG: phosphate regulon sensor histidine kinase PhoR [Burkholderiales bacterium]|nr:phosphate regulon sensor histidine kinase PhoR [Burkholderiales bacterium]
MNPVWIRSALALAAVAVAGLITWALADPVWALAVVCFGLVLLLARHVANLAALADWLRDPMAKPVPQGGGVWDGVLVGLYRFVRARIKEKEQLGGDLQRFRNAGLALPDGVILLDAHDHIEWCNPIASHYLGLDEQRDLGRPLVNLVRHPDLAAYLEHGDYAEPLTLRLSRGEGRVLSLAIISYGEEQKLLLANDITLAEKVETMRRDFVANVSHELKSPLTVVAGFLETLNDGNIKLDEERRQGYLNMMREHTGRMQRLVEDLLTLSALEDSQGLNDETLVDVAALLAGVRDEALALSGGRHRVELSVEDPLSLLANAQELRSAFNNLVSNAVRYTPAGGNIRLGWGRRGADAVFSVSDTGSGIEPRHIPRLTERFYRVDHSRSRETGGTGLGLAIVKHVLTRHQATLEIESEAGEGSRFSAVFPARRVKSTVDSVPARRPAPIGGNPG